MVNLTGPLQAGDIRRNVIPAADLDLQGDTGQPLKLLTDVEVVLALLSILGPNGPRLAQAGLSGALITAPAPDALSVIGTLGNVWNNVLTGVNTNGNVIDLLGASIITWMAVVSAGTTLTLMESPDGVNFVAGPALTLGAAGNSSQNLQVGARFVTLQSTANVTATATIQGKAA